MRTGFYSPLPPANTGVADYSAALIEAMRRIGRVDVNPVDSDVRLYHLGNNPLHREIYRRALEQPGVIVLHDAVLHHFLLGFLKKEQYVDKFVYNYGEWMRDAAQELWCGRARSAATCEYFRHPMLKRIVEASSGVVVHNPGAAAMVLLHCPGARVFEIPHLFCASAATLGVDRLKDRLGLGPHHFVFGVFGYLRESKRLMPVLRAFRRMRRAQPNAALLVVGSFASADLERAAGPLLASPGVICTGSMPQNEFDALISLVNVCINLRHPAAGETSGIAIRAMGTGKAVILTDTPETSRFPENTCLRIAVGPDEERTLAALMLWLAQYPAAAREIGSRAASYIGREHNLERIARLYWEALGYNLAMAKETPTDER